MSIEIKKSGKNTYYRKDGNKMGGRKEKQEVLNISIKHWKRDMAVRYRAGAKTMTGWGQFEGMIAGGFKKGEMAMVGVICGAFPEDHFKSNVALGAVRAVERGKVVMIGMEHEFDHTDRLAEELKIHGKYMPYNRPIQLAYVDGVPYNPMDEFDRPNFYKEKQFIVDLPDSIYPKNPEEVLSEQFKIDVNDTHQKLVTDAINSFVNVNKPYKLVVDNEGRQLYPEANMGLEDVNLKTSLDKVPETHVDENVWYMQKSKITLVIPDWMIEPKDVCEYMNSTGISEEEKEDTLIKRLNTLLEGTYYKPLLLVKIVPDQERTMLYKIAIVKDKGGPCLCNLENTTFNSKLEALAESYYILRKNGLKTTEELKDVWKENNIGRGNIVPEIHTISKAELLFLLEKEMIDGSSYQVLQSTNEEGTDTYYNIEYNINGKKSDSEKVLLHTWCKTEYEALSKFYTYLFQNKGLKND